MFRVQRGKVLQKGLGQDVYYVEKKTEDILSSRYVGLCVSYEPYKSGLDGKTID